MSRALVLALALVAAGATAASAAEPAAASATAHKTYSARSFFETTSYGMADAAGHAFSPDGRSILISNDKSGVFNTYLLPVNGGPAKALTTSKESTFAASFFPADDRVLVTADQGGNELDHVYVRERDGSLRDLTPGEKVKAGFIGWSADGKRFFVMSNERDATTFDVWTYDAASYARQMVFQNSGFEIGAISRDGRWLALVKPRTSADGDVYLADLAAKAAPRLITAHKGNVNHGVYAFTPDEKALIYSTDEHGEFNQAWTHDLATGEKRPLIAAEWDVLFVSHSPSGRYRVSAINADASTRLTIRDLKTGKDMILAGVPDGDLGGVRFNRDETAIAFTVASDTSPADVFVADLKSGQARRLTTALNPAIDEGQLVEATVARFKSYDGLEVPGVLYRPKNASAATPVPALVFVHGGPGGQSRKGYAASIQHLVNHGYAVYAINNRGSSGYGKTFFHLDDRRHGDADLKDVVAAKDWLKSLDWVSDDQVGVMGGSYGGYMVAAALAFEPEAFDVGIDIFGVTNWVRTLTSIPPWWASFKEALYDEMGDPETDGERHRRISPLFHAGGIKKPLLVVQGSNDPRVLQVESDELVAAVRANGVPVEYVVFPDEGHGFLKRENRISASEAYLKFLDTHLARK